MFSYRNTSNFFDNIPLLVVFSPLFSMFGHPDESRLFRWLRWEAFRRLTRNIWNTDNVGGHEMFTECTMDFLSCCFYLRMPMLTRTCLDKWKSTILPYFRFVSNRICVSEIIVTVIFCYYRFRFTVAISCRGTRGFFSRAADRNYIWRGIQRSYIWRVIQRSYTRRGIQRS